MHFSHSRVTAFAANTRSSFKILSQFSPFSLTFFYLFSSVLSQLGTRIFPLLLSFCFQFLSFSLSFFSQFISFSLLNASSEKDRSWYSLQFCCASSLSLTCNFARSSLSFVARLRALSLSFVRPLMRRSLALTPHVPLMSLCSIRFTHSISVYDSLVKSSKKVVSYIK